MKIAKQTDGVKITKEFFSKTISQDFEYGAYDKNVSLGVLCIPHISFSKDPWRKIVSLRMDWGFMVKGLIEFFLDDTYYIDYHTTDNEKEEVDKLIAYSKSQFRIEFDKKSPKKINIDFDDFHGTAKDILLRDQILSMIHDRD